MLFFSILGICCAFIAPIIFAMIARQLQSFLWQIITVVSLVPYVAVFIWVPINYEWHPVFTIFGWYAIVSWITPTFALCTMSED